MAANNNEDGYDTAIEYDSDENVAEAVNNENEAENDPAEAVGGESEAESDPADSSSESSSEEEEANKEGEEKEKSESESEEEDETNCVVMISSDKKKVTISRKLTAHMGTLQEMIDILGESAAAEPIPVPNVTAEILELVVKFCKVYKNFSTDYTPYVRNPVGYPCNPKSVSLLGSINGHQRTLLLNAANYLYIPRLIDDICYYVAECIKTMNVKEMRKALRMTEDFSFNSGKRPETGNAESEESADQSSQQDPFEQPTTSTASNPTSEVS